MAAKLSQVAPMLNVEDVDRSLGFYRDRLAFRVVESHGEYGETFWCMLQRDGVTLMLNRTDQSDRAARLARSTYADAILYVFCNNAHSEHADLTDRGVEPGDIERTDYGMDEFVVRDPDGYILIYGSNAPKGA